ncbi:MAG: N-acetylneuraminate synthase family protein [Candidatus Doudnabacteria bacterium]|nr:N-acetylneuraminate synthase family protein [Candidatus Doudnabacteria bacterium]
MQRDIFEDLFVLEMASNHLGSLDRALKIVEQHSKIVRFNNVRAAIKLQFRDVDNFVHKNFTDRKEIRYIRRTLETKMSKEDYGVLVEAIKKSGCIPMATPFDEKSVDLCVEFNMPIIKVASADSNDWMLLEKIASTKKPVIVSVGGLSLKDMDDMVTFFEHRNTTLAINHCVAAYPHEDSECELDQIDFLKNRFPDHTIGLSTHEYHDWYSSLLIAYGKGARTFERHIDIDEGGAEVAKYSSLPEQIDVWFRAYNKAREMCGTAKTERRVPLERESKYLDGYIRGVYAKHDLKKGDILMEEDIYMAIPLQKGQISSRELMLGKYGHKMIADCKADEPIKIDIIDTPYAHNEELKKTIYGRGL